MPFLVIVAICLCLPCVLIVYRYLGDNQGANEEVINKLPTRVYTQEDLDNAANAAKNDTQSTNPKYTRYTLHVHTHKQNTKHKALNNYMRRVFFLLFKK